mmetsp:Transcript_25682/g.77294  ORF Transcript_25682/g.77294 Transcript_25682/m.77294 type:complete len:221 (-) Transcript_25682:307-969(-)
MVWTSWVISKLGDRAVMAADALRAANDATTLPARLRNSQWFCALHHAAARGPTLLQLLGKTTGMVRRCCINICSSTLSPYVELAIFISVDNNEMHNDDPSISAAPVSAAVAVRTPASCWALARWIELPAQAMPTVTIATPASCWKEYVFRNRTYCTATPTIICKLDSKRHMEGGRRTKASLLRTVNMLLKKTIPAWYLRGNLRLRMMEGTRGSIMVMTTR